MRILEVVGLTKRFGRIAALDVVSFTAEEGQVVALIGPEGAGKTACLRCVAGALAPDSGRVIFDGREITGEPLHRVARAGIAYGPRRAGLFKALTAVDCVAAGLRAPRHPRLAALFGRWAGRETRRHAMALLGRVGLDDHATEPVGLLPPAMQRRLALALALVSDPRLLLLDDPFGGLSTEDRAAFAESIRGLHANGLTVILAARELEAATALADRLLVLDRGALIASGPPERVCRDPRVIAACGHEARVVSRT